MSKKKVAAGIIAVQEYLREEEKAAAGPSVQVMAVPSLWSLAGRQELISQRALVIARLWK